MTFPLKDPDTGEFIPNKKDFELYPDDDNVSAGIHRFEPKETLVMKSSDFGNVYLMMQAAEKSGLLETLQECFPFKLGGHPLLCNALLL